MKKCICLFIVLVICALTACSTIVLPQTTGGVSTDPEQTEVFAEASPSFKMERLGTDSANNMVYYRDITTDVIYLRYREKAGYAGIGGITVMLDPATGLPLTYARYVELSSALAEKQEGTLPQVD